MSAVHETPPNCARCGQMAHLHHTTMAGSESACDSYVPQRLAVGTHDVPSCPHGFSNGAGCWDCMEHQGLLDNYNALREAASDAFAALLAAPCLCGATRFTKWECSRCKAMAALREAGVA